MINTITPSASTREEWLQQLANVITDPLELLQQLRLESNLLLLQDATERNFFPFRVPRTFAARMEVGNPNDPLLRQVLTTHEELYLTPGFSRDPLDEHNNLLPGLLHKYHNRALLLVKSSCAVNCRYCFRRHFPYKDNVINRTNWLPAKKYILQHTAINEIILSGGDPLMAKDKELDTLITMLEDIPHLTTLRIHTRLPVVIPARITAKLCHRLAKSRFKVVLVTHINHAKEIDATVRKCMEQLKNSQVTLLNQSVLLRGINDNAVILANLSQELFATGIIPYYIHMLDPVQGAAHFMVEEHKARKIMQQLLEQVAGYLVPRLARDIRGDKSKHILDLWRK